jgi:hypothetical protein
MFSVDFFAFASCAINRAVQILHFWALRRACAECNLANGASICVDWGWCFYAQQHPHENQPMLGTKDILALSSITNTESRQELNKKQMGAHRHGVMMLSQYFSTFLVSLHHFHTQ